MFAFNGHSTRKRKRLKLFSTFGLKIHKSLGFELQSFISPAKPIRVLAVAFDKRWPIQNSGT